MKTVKNFECSGNGDSKPYKLFGIIANNTDKIQEVQVVQRFKELEDTIDNLQKQAQINSKKLADVVASNAKYLSIIAHDLRSPFASIIAVMEMLQQSLKQCDTKKSEEYIAMAVSSASQTLMLLDDLLPWAMSQSKELTINPVKFNLKEIFVSEIDRFKIQARQKQITLRHSIIPNLHITADLQMVKTILRNLIGNAIKFTYSGGEITLSSSEKKSPIEIVVRDTGIGLSEERQAKLFKQDVICSTEGTNNELGTGLGLRLCKEFVELHGGKIWIESELGTGSEFKFTLPRYI